MEQQGNEYFESLSPEEKFEIELSNEIITFKNNVVGAISRELNFPIPEDKVKKFIKIIPKK